MTAVSGSFIYKMEDSQNGETGTWPRLDETKEYLSKHRILDLFNNMTSELIYNRPEDPKKYMINMLEKLEKSRKSHVDYPCIFDDSNIQSVFIMLDPTNRGYITVQQYKEALTTLGVCDFNENPDGASDDKIVFDTFLSEAREGLHRASATFNQ